jgi:hypothetical protein
MLNNEYTPILAQAKRERRAFVRDLAARFVQSFRVRGSSKHL